MESGLMHKFNEKQLSVLKSIKKTLRKNYQDHNFQRYSVNTIFSIFLPDGHHELRGTAGRSGSSDCQRTVQRHQSGHFVRLYWCRGSPPERWHLPVFTISCALWQAGCTALQRKSGKLTLKLFSLYLFIVHDKIADCASVSSICRTQESK